MISKPTPYLVQYLEKTWLTGERVKQERHSTDLEAQYIVFQDFQNSFGSSVGNFDSNIFTKFLLFAPYLLVAL
jgi:hypothetical protein